MSKSLDDLKSLLTEAGYEFEIYPSDGELVVSVNVAPPTVELPAALEPFAWSFYEVERAIWKGITEKKTMDAARFELALRDYAGHLMHEDPESEALEATLSEVSDLAGLDAYQAKRRMIWDRIIARPDIAEWDAQLEAMY